MGISDLTVTDIGNLFWDTRFFIVLATVIPILVFGLKERNNARIIRNYGTPQVSREIIKLSVEAIVLKN